MKIFICLSVLIATTATCDTVTGVEIESDAATKNDITTPVYSRVNQEVYKTVHPVAKKIPNYTVPPIPKLTPVTYRTVTPTPKVYKKPVIIKGPPPVAYKAPHVERTVIEQVGPVAYKTQIYSVPKHVVQTYSVPTERTLSENDDPDTYTDEYSDAEDEPVEYQQEEYPTVQIGPTYAPPVAVYKKYPSVVRRGYHVPAYRRPSYARVFNIGPPAYRNIRYGRPFGYPVSSVRNLAYGYSRGSQPGVVRYVYGPSNVAYENGLTPVQYADYIDGEYDDFLKKK